MRLLDTLLRLMRLQRSSAATCPHCYSPITGSGNICPSCRRLLRFEGIAELHQANSHPDCAWPRCM